MQWQCTQCLGPKHGLTRRTYDYYLPLQQERVGAGAGWGEAGVRVAGAGARVAGVVAEAFLGPLLGHILHASRGGGA